MTAYEEEIEHIIETETEAVEGYKNNEIGSLNYLVGCAMKETGGRLNPTRAKEMLEERLDDRVVEVEIPYDDDYNVSEKVEVIDGIPDTLKAREMFRFVPEVSVTYEWDKDNNTLTPVAVTIDREEYELNS